MLGPDLPFRLGGSDVRQRRGHRLTGQGGARAEQFGVLEAPEGFGFADPQPGGQNFGVAAGAQFFRGAFGAQTVVDLVIEHGL